MYLAILFAFLTGVTKVVSRSINAELSAKVGTMRSTVYNFTFGLITSCLLLLITNTFHFYHQLSDIKSWMLLGGIFSVGVVFLLNIVVVKIPSINMTLLLFVGQMLAALILDAFLEDRFSLGKLMGVVCVTLGLVFILSEDQRTSENDVSTKNADSQN
jgi:bacterial/archaeal transporter family-2 protein